MRGFSHHGNRSDTSLVLKVGELIDIAMGEPDKNLVDFKMLQNVLYILASHLRILERKVEIKNLREEDTEDEVRTSEEEIQKPKHKPKRGDKRTKYVKKGSSGSVEDLSSDGYVSSEESIVSHESDDSGRTETSEENKDKNNKILKAKHAGDKDEDTSHEEKKRQKEKYKDRDDAGTKGKEIIDEDERSIMEYKDRKTQDKENDDAQKTKGDIDSIQDEEKRQRVKKKDEDDASMKAKDRKVEDERSIEEYKDKKTPYKEEVIKGKGSAKDEKHKRSDTEKTIGDKGKDSSYGENKRQKDKYKERHDASIKAKDRKVEDERTGLSNGSIELVTQREFKMLERQVAELQAHTKPLPEPWLPDNEELMKGEVSLADVMQAMQLQSRMQAAEKATARLAELIAELVSAGVMLGTGEQLGTTSNEAHLERWKAPALSASGITGATSEDWKKANECPEERHTKWIKPKPTWSEFTGASADRSADWKKTRCVTAEEMQESLRAMRKDFNSQVNQLTGRAHHTANNAAEACRRVEDEMAKALNLNEQLTTLQTTITLHSEQLQGYSEAGINSQMETYQHQLNAMNENLQEGLQLWHSVTSNTETTDVVELREQFDILANDLEDTLHNHQKLSNNHAILQREFMALADVVEQLRETKADREEIDDAIKDKADMSRLDDLVEREYMENVKTELEIRIQMCNDKSRAQDAVWMNVIQELNEVITQKIEVIDVEALRDQMQDELHQLNKKAIKAAKMLKDPKAAILSRRLMKEASCAACAQPAMMEITTEPLRLPAFRPRPLGAEDEVCYRERTALPKLSAYESVTPRHICKRWCGGSHTKFSRAVAREICPSFDTGLMTYMGSRLGTDNKVYYRAVESCQPCEECDAVENIPGEIEGFCLCSESSDQGDGPTIVTGQEARRVTVVRDEDIQLVQVEMAGSRRASERRRS